MRSYTREVMAIAALLLCGTGFAPSSARSVKCESCLTEMGGGGVAHSYQAGGAGYFPWGSHTNWQPASCADHHQGCSEAFEDDVSVMKILQNVDNSSFESTLEQLLEAVQNDPSVVKFNKSRSAIQIYGCDGVTVVAHYPLTPDLGDALSAALTN